MKKNIILTAIFIFAIITFSNSQKIKVYFNRPVNNSVSSGTNAIYLNRSIDDTLIAYINRAKYSLDFAIYSFNETAEITSISEAINNAYTRGVAIRWIYDGNSSNPSIPLLNSNINKLISPTGMQYGLMHNKFVIIDANSSNPNEPIVWTGSTNFTSDQINKDANNVIIIQDKNVALAYTTEFNEMWGSTGLAPDLGNSKFGQYKSNNTPHTFLVDGIPIEVYFSPSDGTNSKLINLISTANVDLYFGIYSFTVSAIADSIASKFQNNVYTAGIIDPTSNSYTPYATLSSIMGANLIKDNISGLYHNKLLIVDPSAPKLNPAVFTGSHNWSVNADTKNDENTVVVYDSTIANIYYQSFYQNFIDEGGTLLPQSGIASITNNSFVNIYPNPCSESAIININNTFGLYEFEITIFDVLGNTINLPLSNEYNSYKIDTSKLPTGIYIVKVESEQNVQLIKLQVIR